MTISIPENAKIILESLKNAGFEAYCVGGAVRDSIMNVTPGDWDITTSALPEETRELFKDFNPDHPHYRLRSYVERNCEQYPTHELGPIAKILGIEVVRF